MTIEKNDLLHVPEFRPVRSSSRWKAGIDIGRTSTICHELYMKPGTLPRASSSVLPTLIGYPGKALLADPRLKNLIEIGHAAARRRDHFEVFSPLDAQPPRRPAVLLEFAGALGREMGRKRSGRPWGVMAVPADAQPGEVRELRTMAGELFDRLLLVEEHLLIAMGVLRDPARGLATVVDIGARSVRASLVGGSPSPERRRVVPQGGEAVDAELKRLLLEKYPDLVLTDLTITRMKEQLSSVAPVRRTARVKVEMGPSQRTLDITDILQEACETQVPAVVRALAEILQRSLPDPVEKFAERIFLTGGGACMPGLAERVQMELDRAGYERAVVHTVAQPHMVLALGALKWALVTPDEAWEVPLFAFRPAG